MRIFRRVAQMFDFKDDVAEGEFLTKQGGLLVGAAGGGGGLTFAQILASFAALGVEFDDTTGTMVVSPSDINRALMTLKAPAGFYNSGYYQSFELVDENDNIVTTFSVDGDIDALQPAGHGGGAGWQIRSVDFPQNRMHFDARELLLSKAQDNQLFLALYNLDGSDVLTGDVFSVDERLRLRMKNVAGAPADGDIADGYFHWWPDATDGAPFWRAKGKTLDGTVVSFAIPTGTLSTAADLSAHVSDAADAHAGTAITNTPAGNVAATTVQAAINELDSEKAATTHAHAGEDVTSGTVADARIASTIARDSEVTSAVAAEATARDTAIGVETSARTAADALLVAKAIVDAKGDLIAASAADTVARLPVGSNDQVLTADSAQTLGVKWATAAAGGMSATLFDANTILKADTDDTPVALTMGASTILARLASGGIKAATPAELRTLLALVVGTDVQAQDAELAALAGLTSAADKGIQFTGSGTAATYDLTTAGKALLDDASAAAQLTTLGLTSGALPPWTPSYQGLLAANYDPASITGQTTGAAGRLEMIKVRIPGGSISVTNILMILAIVGSGLNANQCFAGIYDSSGNRLGVTADQASAWASGTGLKTMAISGGPITVSGPYCYVVHVANRTAGSQPSWRQWSAGGQQCNVGLASGTERSASNATGQTSLPSTITLSSNSADSNMFWAGLS